MNWLEITINTVHDRLEPLTDRLTSLGVEGIITEDEEDVARFLEDNKKYWDYVDEDFLSSMKGVCRLKFYVEDSQNGREDLRRLQSALADTELFVRAVKDEDWENNWKQYYKPIAVGSRLIIVPQWEKLPPEAENRIPLRLDPGLIFGTGAHATTQMCLEALDTLAAPGKTMLDLGCGSGILAIAGLLLGCDTAIGCDIDEKAPPVVMENAGLNSIGTDRLTAFAGDVLNDRDVSRHIGERKFDIITANIVADVIIALAPRAKSLLGENGVFICSGIIEGRQSEVASALTECGFDIFEHKHKDDWHCYLCR